MSSITPLMPRQKVPALDLPLAGGGRFTLGETKPANFTLLVFYRGLHCPICGRYLADLQSKLDAFAERGVDVVAVSSDSGERADEAKAVWKLDKLRVAYGLPLEEARAWGLYISTSKGKTSTGVVEIGPSSRTNDRNSGMMEASAPPCGPSAPKVTSRSPRSS